MCTRQGVVIHCMSLADHADPGQSESTNIQFGAVQSNLPTTIYLHPLKHHHTTMANGIRISPTLIANTQQPPQQFQLPFGGSQGPRRDRCGEAAAQ